MSIIFQENWKKKKMSFISGQDHPLFNTVRRKLQKIKTQLKDFTLSVFPMECQEI